MTEKRLRTDDTLPTPEEAQRAFLAAQGVRQHRVRSVLRRLAEAPPQVLILEGGTVEERFSVALWHAAQLNCQAGEERPCLTCPSCLQIGVNMFPDLFLLDGREGSIKIDTVRELRSILSEAPRGEGKRVILLAEAQSLGVEAANALLKSMEEPHPHVCFLLLTPQRERLLPTLVSRGWVVTLAWPALGSPVPAALHEWEQELARFMTSGKGWLGKTSGKGAVDATLARELILCVQKAQAAVLAQRDGSVLGKPLMVLSETDHMELSALLAQSQDSLDAMVNPALVLDWLATHLYALCRKARTASKRRP